VQLIQNPWICDGIIAKRKKIQLRMVSKFRPVRRATARGGKKMFRRVIDRR
jgi:hypothetical protein